MLMAIQTYPMGTMVKDLFSVDETSSIVEDVTALYRRLKGSGSHIVPSVEECAVEIENGPVAVSVYKESGLLYEGKTDYSIHKTYTVGRRR